ncbi:hypothetical protein [Microbacterium sp. A84]|uniref:hypothetical protein n=1 Tax=Microbacterium sp. A84 TaxID=3450715 RepID=UPI003F42BB1D
MDTAAWVALAVAVIALLGVLAAQTITLFNESRRRRDELTKLVRDDGTKLMMEFYKFSEFATRNQAAKKSADSSWYEAHATQWDLVSPELPSLAARLAGRGKHRTVILSFIDGIRLIPTSHHLEVGLGQTERDDYREISWWAFETAAAWLRGERVPRHARRIARRLRKIERKVDAHYRREDAYKSDAKVPTGVVRKAYNKSMLKLRESIRSRVVEPVRKFWLYLFAE